MVLEIDRIQSRSKRNADLPTWDKSLPYSMQKIYGRAPTISRPSLRSPPMISPQIQGALREVILASRTPIMTIRDRRLSTIATTSSDHGGLLPLRILSFLFYTRSSLTQ